MLTVTVAADGFLSPEQTPALPHRLNYVPLEDRTAIIADLARSDVLLTRRVNVDEDLLRQVPNLRLVQQVGAGLDRIDIAATKRHGVLVANTPDAPAPAVIEHVFMTLLALLRSLGPQMDAMKSGGWAVDGIWQGREIGGSNFGIIGYGAIGRGIAERALAFGANVTVATRTVPKTPEARLRFTDIPSLLSACDIVILCVPLTAATKGLIGPQELGRMRPDAMLVNVARGAVIDEPALIDALTGGRLGGAALDVFTEEPLAAASPLRQMKNVVLTPHSAGATRGSRARMWAQIAENFDRLAAGEPIATLVTQS